MTISHLYENSQAILNGHRSPEAKAEAQLMAILAQRARELAQKPEEQTAGDLLQLLVFRLNGERYGVAVTGVREIYPLEQITTVPRTPNYVVGVFNARGRLISVIDLRALFGLQAMNISESSKIVVVSTDTAAYQGDRDIEVGFLADDVEDVLTIFEHDLESSAAANINLQAQFTRGITPDMLIVLDLNSLLNSEQLIVYEEIL